MRKCLTWTYAALSRRRSHTRRSACDSGVTARIVLELDGWHARMEEISASTFPRRDAMDGSDVRPPKVPVEARRAVVKRVIETLERR